MEETAEQKELNALIKMPSHYKAANRSRIIRVSKDHPFYRTSNRGNVSESRLIMAEHLGRNLTDDDVVCRKDNDYENNEVSNFIVLTRGEFATVRDWKRLKNLGERIKSMIAVYEEKMTEAGIDPVTLTREVSTDRCREVDRDRESFNRSRIHRGGEEE